MLTQTAFSLVHFIAELGTVIYKTQNTLYYSESNIGHTVTFKRTQKHRRHTV